MTGPGRFLVVMAAASAIAAGGLPVAGAAGGSGDEPGAGTRGARFCAAYSRAQHRYDRHRSDPSDPRERRVIDALNDMEAARPPKGQRVKVLLYLDSMHGMLNQIARRGYTTEEVGYAERISLPDVQKAEEYLAAACDPDATPPRSGAFCPLRAADIWVAFAFDDTVSWVADDATRAGTKCEFAVENAEIADAPPVNLRVTLTTSRVDSAKRAEREVETICGETTEELDVGIGIGCYDERDHVLTGTYDGVVFSLAVGFDDPAQAAAVSPARLGSDIRLSLAGALIQRLSPFTP
jgi:hypothetical protein